MNNENIYDESSIEKIGDIEHIRLRPSLYIGSIDIEGVHHCFKEIFANALDEHLVGYGDSIIIQKKGDQIAVRDFGRGIPFGLHEGEGISALTLVATSLKAGGKFNDNSYKISGGIHGMGLSIVNALSDSMIVQSTRNGATAVQHFRQGKPVTDVIINSSDQPSGTLVAFTPDKTIFDDINIPLEWFVRDAYFAACLNSIKILLSLDGQELTLENLSPASMIEKMTSHEPIQIPWITSKGVYVRFAFGISSDPRAYLFVNGIPVTKGNFLNSFLECFAARLRNSGLDFQADDLPYAMSMVIAVKAPTSIIEFAGQVKDSANIKGTNLNLFFDTVLEYVWKERGFKTLLKSHYKPVLSIITKKRLYEKELKNVIKILKEDETSSSFLLPGTLTDCRLKWQGELFICEGISAAGTCKQSRNREFQAILPLKGKILNTLKAGLEETLSNDVIKTLFQVIGVEITKNKTIKITPRYSKIILLLDPDKDGQHQACLLLVFFLQWCRPLIENGYVWIARAPLYRIVDKKGKIIYAFNDQELVALQIPKSSMITRHKGLGEMDVISLQSTVFEPTTRQLVQITLDGGIEQASTVAWSLMGSETETRLDFLHHYASEIGHDFDLSKVYD